MLLDALYKKHNSKGTSIKWGLIILVISYASSFNRAIEVLSFFKFRGKPINDKSFNFSNYFAFGQESEYWINPILTPICARIYNKIIITFIF